MGRLIIALLMCLASLRYVQAQVVGGVPHPPGEGRIAGRILNDSGEPLPDATVLLLLFMDAPESTGFRWATRTAPDGSYAFARLPAGRVRVTAEKSGYTSLRVYENRFVSGHRDLDLEASGSHNGIDLVMHRAGSIAGRVTDENGQPASEARVQATIRVADGKFVATGVPIWTDPEGRYRLPDIPAGSYYVLASASTLKVGQPVPRERREYTRTFHPDVVDAGRATQVRIGPGVHVRDIDIRMQMQQLYAIQGTITDASGTVPRNLRLEYSALEYGHSGVFTDFQIDDGRFDIDGVSPGRAVLLARGKLDGATVVGIEIVEVSDASLTDLHIIVGTPARIAGRVIVEGGTLADIPQLVIEAVPAWFRSRHGDEELDRSAIEPTGRFAIDGLLGERRIVESRLPPQWRVKEIRRGGRVVEGGRVTVVAGDAVEDLEIIVVRHPIP